MEIIMVCCIYTAIFLFRSYCYREILNCIPEKMDQVGYINMSYKVYDHILKNGLLQGFIFGINNSLNSGMTLVGAVSLFIFGLQDFRCCYPIFSPVFYVSTQWHLC